MGSCSLRAAVVLGNVAIRVATEWVRVVTYIELI
jgi:hypothetical protein